MRENCSKKEMQKEKTVFEKVSFRDLIFKNAHKKFDGAIWKRLERR